MKQIVHVVDDDQAVLDSIGFMLSSVGIDSQRYTNARQFLDAYDDNPGCLILDVRMPGMSGLELQQEINQRHCPELSIIFISGHADIPMAVAALKAGATDFLTKPFREQDLLDRVQHALQHNEQQHQSQEQQQAVLKKIESLTDRERQVMAMVAAGKANKVIAIDLNISTRTVELHRANVMHKMQVRSLAELVKALYSAGYLDDD